MAQKSGGGPQVCVGTAYAAPGAKTVMNGTKSSGGGKKAPQVRVGKNNMSRKGSSRGR
jgi:hypothetical protein